MNRTRYLNQVQPWFIQRRNLRTVENTTSGIREPWWNKGYNDPAMAAFLHPTSEAEMTTHSRLTNSIGAMDMGKGLVVRQMQKLDRTLGGIAGGSTDTVSAPGSSCHSTRRTPLSRSLTAISRSPFLTPLRLESQLQK